MTREAIGAVVDAIGSEVRIEDLAIDAPYGPNVGSSACVWIGTPRSLASLQ